MKTFLKVVLFLGVGLIALKVFPVLLAPALLSVIAMLVIGAVLLGGLAATVAAGLVLAFGLVAAALGIMTALSPLWVPVLAIIGVISLCRRPKATA